MCKLETTHHRNPHLPIVIIGNVQVGDGTTRGVVDCVELYIVHAEKLRAKVPLYSDVERDQDVGEAESDCCVTLIAQESDSRAPHQ